MEGLPNDALLLVLNKLAVQDPPSLLRAICAVKSLYGLAKANPSILKNAFYGPALWKDTMTFDESLFFEKQSAELEARLNALEFLDLQPAAGYKELVEARLKFFFSKSFLVSAPGRERLSATAHAACA